MNFNYKPNLNLKQYLKVEESLTMENHDLIEEHNFFKELQLMVINVVVGLGWIRVKFDWGRELVV
jgi:hypothetical protein